MTLLGSRLAKAQGAHVGFTSSENQGPWHPSTSSRKPPIHARPSLALASVKKERGAEPSSSGAGLCSRPPD